MGLRSYKPMRQQSAKAKAVEAILNEARPRVFARDGWRCQLALSADCSGRAEDLHHLRLRSQGGQHDDANLLSACRSCHQYAHNHPGEAREAGFIL